MPQRGGVRETLDNAASICTIVASIVIVGVILNGRFGARISERARLTAPAEDVQSLSFRLDRADPNVRQGRDARVAVIEFSDFECPYCGKYARETFPRIKRDFVETGKVAYVFKHFPLEQIHGRSFEAAEAAACAGEQASFWEMHDLIFADQKALGLRDLMGDAVKLGLDQKQFQSCVSRIGPKVKSDESEGRRLGVTATPTFLLGIIGSDGSVTISKRISGARPYETFKTAIEAFPTS
jgi:protein-disulfide isomerase